MIGIGFCCVVDLRISLIVSVVYVNVLVLGCAADFIVVFVCSFVFSVFG